MHESTRDNAGVVAPPPLIYAGTLALGLLLQRLFPLPFLPGRLARTLGVAVAGFSFLVGGPAFAAMRRAKTNLSPLEPTTAIVTSGPFRYSRNPIYISLTMLYSGLAIFANSLWAILLLPVLIVTMTRGVIEREERYLARKFGADYLQYKARVRRWL